MLRGRGPFPICVLGLQAEALEWDGGLRLDQSGREFEDELIERSNLLPEFVAACEFANAKAPGFETDDFLAAAVAPEERASGSALVASGDRDSFQLASIQYNNPLPVARRRTRAHRARRGSGTIWR